ncbi:MAG TPA: anthranilate synthase component I family protein, partial [Sulfurimonas autotrophica]|nr:anthranilate synthase component I family protein [Sulfurimonas autotrophica]
FSFDGNMDSSIAIRTSLIKADSITLQAGGGVVADSIPELEYLEMNNKLGALLATLKEMEAL